jgi:hypothetical protein
MIKFSVKLIYSFLLKHKYQTVFIRPVHQLFIDFKRGGGSTA